ncbi:MAG: hypothetical protein JSR91_08345 [Proteobacteria bacterium]|nr:hypothetical protein [Pseudomonadota bacterium]
MDEKIFGGALRGSALPPGRRRRFHAGCGGGGRYGAGCLPRRLMRVGDRIVEVKTIADPEHLGDRPVSSLPMPTLEDKKKADPTFVEPASIFTAMS